MPFFDMGESMCHVVDGSGGASVVASSLCRRPRLGSRRAAPCRAAAAIRASPGPLRLVSVKAKPLRPERLGGPARIERGSLCPSSQKDPATTSAAHSRAPNSALGGAAGSTWGLERGIGATPRRRLGAGLRRRRSGPLRDRHPRLPPRRAPSAACRAAVGAHGERRLPALRVALVGPLLLPGQRRPSLGVPWLS